MEQCGKLCDSRKCNNRNAALRENYDESTPDVVVRMYVVHLGARVVEAWQLVGKPAYAIPSASQPAIGIVVVGTPNTTLDVGHSGYATKFPQAQRSLGTTIRAQMHLLLAPSGGVQASLSVI